jgi:hypothetical protein
MEGLTKKDLEECIAKLRKAEVSGPITIITTPDEYARRAKDVNFGRVKKVKYCGIDFIIAEVNRVKEK